MKILLLPALLCLSIFSSGQASQASADMKLFKAIGGVPLLAARKVTQYEGSPYFNNEWLKGTIIIDGELYSNVFLKLDVLDNEVHYRDDKANEMVIASAVKRITLFDSITKNSYAFINGRFIPGVSAKNDQWYQLLTDGKVSYLKQILKEIKESKDYGSAIPVQTLITTERYFILYNNQLVKIKKLKDLADILPDKTNEISKFINDRKISGKTQNDFITVINYYNSLK